MRYYDVLLCSCDGEEYFAEQLESILNQTISPKKIIISDDSTSRSIMQMAETILRGYPSVEYVLVEGPHLGVVHNFLSGLKYSDSDFLFFSDQDDIWELNKVEELFKLVSDDVKNKPLLLFSDALLIDSCSNILFDSFIIKQGINTDVLNDDSIQFENCVQGAACCINLPLKNIVMELIDEIDIDVIVMHDWLFSIVARYTGSVLFCNKPLLKYRIHDKNQVGYVSSCEKLLLAVTSPLELLNRVKKNMSFRMCVLLFLVEHGYLSNENVYINNVSELGFFKRLMYKLLGFVFDSRVFN